MPKTQEHSPRFDSGSRHHLKVNDLGDSAAARQPKLVQVAGYGGAIHFEAHAAHGFEIVRLTRLRDVVFCYQARALETGEILGDPHPYNITPAVWDGLSAEADGQIRGREES